ncbi:MAG TPA: hypothetical protein VMI31_01905 [Fimbriimonadaceae bacterium]|nr:hypothetical protein [Fimbriimonadaceae bacterium]
MIGLLPQPIFVDPLLIVEAQEVWSVIGRSDNPVWPGWDARRTPILIYFPGKEDLLINHPKPPAGFTKYTGPIQTTIGPIYLRDGKTVMDFDGQNTAVDVNGTQTLVVADSLSTRRQWVEGLVPALNADPNRMDDTIAQSLFPDPYREMTMFAHEAFHVYQHAKAPDKGGDERALLHYPSLSVENNVGFALESDFLAQAALAKSPAEVRRAALAWLAVRNWRRAALDKEGSAYEDGTEFNEGTAKYVEYRTLKSLQGRRPSRQMWLAQGFRGFDDLNGERANLLRQMQSTMSGTQAVNNDLYGASPVRFRLYYSGMGIGILLDRLGANWHDKIFEPQTSLTGIAESTILATPAELSAALAEVKAGPRFAQLMSEKTQLARDGEAYVASQVSAFDRSPGELVLDYSELEKPRVGFGFTPFGILRVDENRTIYRLLPIRGIVNGLNFTEDGPRPVMQDTKAKAIHFQLTTAPDLRPGELKDASVALPGITLTGVTGRVEVAGRRVLIHLRPAAGL